MTVEQDLGQPKHGDIDLLLVADASINTAAVANRLVDLWPSSVRANGNEATRAGLIASAQGSDPDLGPALDPDVDLLVVDAFGKMNGDHRTSFTEILDNRSYTMTTSYVQETFSAMGSHLFLGNPKYDSFDDFEPLPRQIDYEPELITGVDLVYPVFEAADSATNPLKSSTAREVIEHARTFEPQWTEPVEEELTETVSKIREEDEDTDLPVRLHPRRILEAVRKFSAATAKLRFSDTVTDDGVERAWKSYIRTYQAMGVLIEEEEESQEFDADIVETDSAKEQRDRIQNIKAIISDIESEYDEGAPVDVIIERAEEVGVKRGKAEHEIEQLKQKGEVYEPRTDHLRTF